MKPLAAALTISFGICATLAFAQPPAGSIASPVPNPAAAARGTANSAVQGATVQNLAPLGNSAAAAALRAGAGAAAPVHDIGLVLYHGAAGDGVGARICVVNWGNMTSPPLVVQNLIEHSSDGVSFEYREFPRFRSSVPTLMRGMSHCYNIPARTGIFQRIASRVEDNDAPYFAQEASEARSGAPRQPNALPRFVIQPAR